MARRRFPDAKQSVNGKRHGGPEHGPVSWVGADEDGVQAAQDAFQKSGGDRQALAGGSRALFLDAVQDSSEASVGVPSSVVRGVWQAPRLQDGDDAADLLHDVARGVAAAGLQVDGRVDDVDGGRDRGLTAHVRQAVRCSESGALAEVGAVPLPSLGGQRFFSKVPSCRT